MTAFRDGQVTLRSNRRIDGFTESIKEIGYQGIRRGDLVVHSMDGFAGAIGVSDSDGKASPVVHAYRPRQGMDTRFIAYALRVMAKTEFVVSLAKGIRERSTSFDQSTLADIELPVPAFEEQRRIADFLDAETARLDRLDAARSRYLELLGELSAAHVTSALEFGSRVPKVRLGYLATIQAGVTVDASRSPDGDDVTRPYLRVANVQAGYLDLSQVAEITVPRRLAAASTLQPGDVLMTEGGDLDKLGRGTVWDGQIGRCLHQNHVFAVRVDKRALDAHYLAWLTRTAAARIHFESTGNKTTNLASTSSSKICDLRVPLPPVSQQRAVVVELNDTLAAIEAVSSAVQRQRRLLAERRQALITAAVTGQLDVTTARGADLS